MPSVCWACDPSFKKQKKKEHDAMQGIENKVVVITGGSSGLGAETARHLVWAGAKVVLGARRLDRLQARWRKNSASGEESIVQTDVVHYGQVQALVARALEIPRTHRRDAQQCRGDAAVCRWRCCAWTSGARPST
jgi:nucleoside-diphosphate-sugar epimerase